MSSDLTIEKESKDAITSIIKEYWDFFVKDGENVQSSDTSSVLTPVVEIQSVVKNLRMVCMSLRSS